ncbi:hypothetical protein VB735_07755 [Halotia wernerae UHCC 0503]|nr:hypothetical protein [Halotia wernerae UHCC 0503]
MSEFFLQQRSLILSYLSHNRCIASVYSWLNARICLEFSLVRAIAIDDTWDDE